MISSSRARLLVVGEDQRLVGHHLQLRHHRPGERGDAHQVLVDRPRRGAVVVAAGDVEERLRVLDLGRPDDGQPVLPDACGPPRPAHATSATSCRSRTPCSRRPGWCRPARTGSWDRAPRRSGRARSWPQRGAAPGAGACARAVPAGRARQREQQHRGERREELWPTHRHGGLRDAGRSACKCA